MLFREVGVDEEDTMENQIELFLHWSYLGEGTMYLLRKRAAMKKWWCKWRHKNHWHWKTFSWGQTYCYCSAPGCGRQWIINQNFSIKE